MYNDMEDLSLSLSADTVNTKDRAALEDMAIAADTPDMEDTVNTAGTASIRAADNVGDTMDTVNTVNTANTEIIEDAVYMADAAYCSDTDSTADAPNQEVKQDTRQKTPIIQVKNLYKVYKVGDTKVYALDGVDFSIHKGEFCAIVGPSGSGKSTLLNMMAGLEKPSKGEIVIAGKHIEQLTENQLVAFRREHVGFIFQSYNLLQTMNAVENVALPLSFRGVPKKERIAKARKYVKLVGLEKQMKHMANEMSGGQQQRVGIARALAVDPQIIFADEPTGNLDSKTTKEILGLMQRIVKEQNQTLVMVTHDNYIAQFADRQLHIVDGRIFKIEEKNHHDTEEETEYEKDQ